MKAGQVALNPDLSGMPRLRFLRRVSAVALILNMSEDGINGFGLCKKKGQNAKRNRRGGVSPPVDGSDKSRPPFREQAGLGSPTPV